MQCTTFEAGWEQTCAGRSHPPVRVAFKLSTKHNFNFIAPSSVRVYLHSPHQEVGKLLDGHCMHKYDPDGASSIVHNVTVAERRFPYRSSVALMRLAETCILAFLCRSQASALRAQLTVCPSQFSVPELARSVMLLCNFRTNGGTY